MTNAERGRIIREALGEKEVINKGKEKTKPKRGASSSNPFGNTLSTKSKTCDICSNFFSNLERWVDEAEDKLKPYEYSTFAVGTKPGRDIVKREEALWEESGIEHCEPFRSESNREFGKALCLRIKKEVDEKNPDVLVVLDIENAKIDLTVRSVFVYGRYKKLIRGIPQTKWDMYPVTVEDIIAAPFMKALGGRGHSMHAAGREDIDARCLDWRPFVLEIEKPMKRKVSLTAMAASINKTKKVEVSGLRYSNMDEVREVKDMRHDKEYRMLVEFEVEPNKEKLSQLKKLIGPIQQQTPTRVMHRRADLLREREVKSLSWHKVKGMKYEITIRGNAGLYAKEFVNGDGGRTKPSVAEFLGVPAKVIELDVVKIYAK